jgi:NAD(P)-dependent dehydrogenase (short-subunit alcohol dehydrogenase family)
MSEALDFNGKTILITGSTRGISYAYAEYLASLGANLVINGVSEQNVNAAVESLRESAGKVIGIALPVTQGEAIVDFALENFSRIDAVINNAGIVRDAQFKNMTLEEWDEIYRVHLEGAFKITKAIWPHFIDNGGGRILMTSSSAGIFGNFGQANYSAMKAGIIGFTKTLAVEGKKYNIKTNVICPGAHTDMTEGLMKPELKECMSADKVSPVAAYLCHESCDDTGAVIEASGGWIAKARYEYSELAVDLDKPFGIDEVQSLWPELNEFKTKVTHPEKISHVFKAVVAHFKAWKE